MANVDMTSVVLLVFVALGIVSSNTSVAIAAIVLLIFRLLNLHPVLHWLEKYGLTLGIIILTIGILAPLASGKITVQTLSQSFLNWKSLAAVAIGVAVAYLGGRGATLLTHQPTVVTSLLIGTILGVAFLKGVPVGPLIAAGLLSLIIGK